MTTNSCAMNTARLFLEPMTQAEAGLLAELGADPDVVKNLICDWSTPEKRLQIARYWIERNQEYGIWGVFDRDGSFGDCGKMIGICAADEPLPIGGRGPEIYYAFSQDTWGHGVATEVASAVIEYLFEELGVSAVEALVLAGLNPASGRLLEKLGMALVGRYPLVKYVADECIPTIHYELWRVETATRENACRNLEEAAFKIGQFVAEGVETEMNMSDALRRAASANSLVEREGKGLVNSIIEESIRAGMKETGWLHYRIEKTT